MDDKWENAVSHCQIMSDGFCCGEQWPRKLLSVRAQRCWLQRLGLPFRLAYYGSCRATAYHQSDDFEKHNPGANLEAHILGKRIAGRLYLGTSRGRYYIITFA